MKGLRKMIYPFAPDQSGAAAVFYELGGMIIIVDAGGCAGNVCGFDEPRWFYRKSAIFSAGLRDMDAILGRDDLMIEKIEKAAGKIDASFVAIIGTPVPATIATDYRAIRRMGEKRIGLPIITTDTNGALLYDDGAQKAYLELFRTFAIDRADDPGQTIPASVGVLGVTPLDTDLVDGADQICRLLTDRGYKSVHCYGAGGLSEIARAGQMEKNLVVSPAGLKAAKLLKRHFGTPYLCTDPLAEEVWQTLCRRWEQAARDEGPKQAAGQNKAARDETPQHAVAQDAAGRDAGKERKKTLAGYLKGKRILIIHQQIRANSLREIIEKESGKGSDIRVASWFKMAAECRREGDLAIREEDDFIRLVSEGGFDVIMADPSLKKAARGFGGTWIDLPHFAVSGLSINQDQPSPSFYG